MDPVVVFMLILSSEPVCRTAEALERTTTMPSDDPRVWTKSLNSGARYLP